VAVVAVSAPQVPGVIEQCGEAGIPYAVVLAGGFAEIGEAGREVQARLDAAIAKSGVRVVGPNCVGIANFLTRVYCAFGGALTDPTLRPGPMAVVSQSGGVGLGILAQAQSFGVGCSHLLSCGNEADLTVFDFVDTLLQSDEVKLVAMYLEAYTDGRRIRVAGRRALEAGKPILILKVGNNEAGRLAASSHTGRLTADYELFRMAFREGGYIEVGDLDELAHIARLVLAGKFPKGRNMGITTASGGFGVMMAEQCEKNGLILPRPSQHTVERLRELVPSYGSVANPIDMTPQGYTDQYAAYNKLAEILLADPDIDQLMVRSAQGTDIDVWARRFVETIRGSDKPAIVNWSPAAHRFTEVRKFLEDNGVLCVSYASHAARAAGAFTEFALKRRRFEAAGDARAARPFAKQEIDFAGHAGATGTLSEHAAKKCLQRYSIPVTQEVLLSLEQVRALQSSPVPFPVAVKLASPDIPHKTEADAVRLALRDIDAIKQAAATVVANGVRYQSSARIDGVLVQQMASGVELIVGAVDDAHFGPYVLLGLGGVFTEVLHDVTRRFAPFGLAVALEMIGEIKGARLLEGFRGAPPADIDALAQVLVNLSWLIADYSSRIAEIDINPLFVGPKGSGVVAADALVVLHAA
jgi:acetyltransferase